MNTSETIALPMFTDFVVALAASTLLRGLAFRLLTWLLVPLIAAILFAGPHTLFFGRPGEERGWAVIVFVGLAGWGFLASAVGTFAGYGLRRLIDYAGTERD